MQGLFQMKGMNDDKARTAENASAMSLGSARGMARLAAFMANKGTLDGQTLLSE